MLLGKRPRPPMRRTTSMREFSPDVGAPGLDKIHEEGVPPEVVNTSTTTAPAITTATGGGDEGATTHQFQQQLPLRTLGNMEEWEKRYMTALVSPVRRNAPRRNSGDFAVEPAHFLRACGLCRRSLAPGKDIFMYRGEIAFCSSECRQQHMTQDERKDNKCLVTSMKKEATPTNAAPESSSGSGGEAVAAA